MAVHKQGRQRGVLAGDVRDEVGAAGLAFDDDGVDAGLGQSLGGPFGGRALVGGAAAIVAGVESDQPLEERDGFVAGIDGVGDGLSGNTFDVLDALDFYRSLVPEHVHIYYADGQSDPPV